MNESPVNSTIPIEFTKQSLNIHLFDFLNNSISNELANIFLQESQQNHINNPISLRTNLLDQWETFWQIIHTNSYNNQINSNNIKMNNNINGPHKFFLPKKSQLDLLPLMATSTTVINKSNGSIQTVPVINNSQNTFGNIDTAGFDRNDTYNSSEVSSIFPTRSESNPSSSSINSLKNNFTNKRNKKSPSNLSVNLLSSINDTNNTYNHNSRINILPQSNNSINPSGNTIQFENVLFSDALTSNFEGTISSHQNVSFTPKITRKISKSSSKNSKSKKVSRPASSYTGTFQTTGWVQQFPENGTINKSSKKRSSKKNTPVSLESHSRKLEFFGGKNHSQRSNSISSSNCSSTTTASSSSRLRIKRKNSNKSPAICNNPKLHTLSSSQVGTPLDTTTTPVTIEYNNINFNTYPVARFIQTNTHNNQIYNGNNPGYNPAAVEQHSYIEHLLGDKLQFDENALTNVNLDQFEVMHSVNSELNLTSVSHRNSDSSKVSSE